MGTRIARHEGRGVRGSGERKGTSTVGVTLHTFWLAYLGRQTGGRVSLTTNYVAGWHLNEASGNALDVLGVNDLTDNGGCGSGTGIINGARTFNGTTQRFTHVDNADFSIAGTSATFTAWVKLNTTPLTGTARTILAKYNYTTSNREYTLLAENPGTTSRYRFYVSSDGVTAVSIAADSFGIPTANVWTFVVAWIDIVANTINIQINNGPVDSTAYSSGVFDGVSDFEMGSLNQLLNYWMDGLIDETGFWKRVLSAAERTSLYNGGAGLAYPFVLPATWCPDSYTAPGFTRERTTVLAY